MRAPAVAAFRVDASPAIGIGHFIRCLRIADALRSAGTRTIVLTRGLSSTFARIATDRGHELADLGAPPAADNPTETVWAAVDQGADAAATLVALNGTRADWLVVDHYGLDAEWETAVRPGGLRMLAIDDLANRRHEVDILLDQNYYADAETRYDAWLPGGTLRLLGPRYALLDQAFEVRRASIAPRTGPVRRILVCFGGSDVRNYTGLALHAIAQLPAPAPEVDVVIGYNHARRDAIEDECAARGYHCHRQTDRMADLLAVADLAIGAGGSLTWERCALGVPAIVFTLAENQRRVVTDGASAGLLYAPDGLSDADDAFLARHLRCLIENSALRGSISRAGMEAVDARGVSRVVRRLGVSEIDVREATADDSRRLFEWRNALSVRQVSFDRSEIAWESHERWLAGVLANPDRRLLIGLRDGAPVGVVRFDIEGPRAEVSIYLVPGESRAGTGGALLQAAEAYLRERRPDVTTSLAGVRAGNAASHGLFTSAGYAPELIRYRKLLSQDS